MLALPLSPTSAVALRRRTLAPSFTPMSPISSPPPSPSPGLSSDDGEGGLGSKFGSATSSSDRLPTPASSSKALATNLPLRPSVSRKISYTRHSPDLSSSSATSSPIPAPVPAPTPPPPPSSFRLPMASEPPIGRPALFHLGCPESDDDEDDDDDGADDEFHDATSDGHVAPVPLRPPPPPPKRKVNSNSSRYYALLELLHTEARYLFDLRVLVNIYFELLPSLQLSTPKLSPSVSSHFLPRSVATSSAPPSPSKASAAIAANTAARDPRAHARAHSSSSVVGKEPKPKLPPPSLLSSGDIDTIRRNGRQLLDFHTAFLDRLRTIVTDARFRIALNDDGPEDSWDWDTIPKWQDSWEPVLNETIVAVTTLFTTQASLFTVYEPFCSRQLEANEIIGRIARRRKDVWDSYERRCAELLALDRSHRRRRSESRIVAGRTNGDVPSRGRRHSFGAALLSSPVLPEPEAPRRSTSPAKEGEPTPATATPAPKDAGGRLKLADYLVKPMQRVTRYPLLLAGLLIHPLPSAAQLSSSQPFASSAVDLACSDVVVASARLAMDHVAAQVDAAASAQAAYVQSARIAARLAPAPAVKLASFVSNLGPCTLAGPLDVVHHRALRDLGSGSVRAKYLAAFLYTGGFLVLAKVHGARRYEPRHWFDLAGFEVDGMEDGGLLPWSIRLYGPGAEFELACACVAEKRVWMRALRDAAAAQPAWNPGEAPSSIVALLSLSATESHSAEPMPVVAPELPHITPASPFPEIVNPFEHAQTMMFQSPTLSSFPISPTSATASHFSPTDVQSLSLTPVPVLCDSTSPPGTVSSCSEAHAPLPPPPSRKSSRPKLGREPPRASISSRRSSTASVKAFFSAAPDRAVMVSRATALARQEVDDALRDVLSGVIADARGRAGVAGLFDSLDRQQVVRGEAGVGVVGAIGVAARNRLRKRESLLVRRATTSSDGPLATPVVPPVPRLTVATDRPSLVFGGSDEQLVLSPDPESQSHSNSHSHSHSHSRSSSVLPALPPPLPPKIDVEFSPSEIYKEPVALLDPSYLLPSGQDTEDTLRGRVHRSRSMVDNVRGFFSSSGLSVAERDRGPTRSASILLQQGGGTVSVRRRVTDSLRASRPPRRSAESASEHGSSKGMLRSLFSPFVRSSTAPAGS